MTSILRIAVGVLTTTVALSAQIWTEVGDAGDLPGTAQVPAGAGPLTRVDGTIDDPTIAGGAGNDRDMYLIQIDDPATFGAVTAGTDFNMQLFLFDSNGFGVGHHDNIEPFSFGGFDVNARLTGQFVPGPGLYYLAVSRFDRDATAGGLQIWQDVPLDVERAPDGPGAAGPIECSKVGQRELDAASAQIDRRPVRTDGAQVQERPPDVKRPAGDIDRRIVGPVAL